MSVFTSLERHKLVEFLQNYTAGELLGYEGIENTNYFVTTTGKQMVLTLFETRSFEEIIHRKDPDVFRRILQQRQQQDCSLPIDEQH